MLSQVICIGSAVPCSSNLDLDLDTEPQNLDLHLGLKAQTLRLREGGGKSWTIKSWSKSRKVWYGILGFNVPLDTV